MGNGIIAGGNFIIDFTRVIDGYPDEETLSSILSLNTGSGGAAYNVLIDLAKMGADFPLYGIGMVGDDNYGKIILNDCRQHGINTEGIKVTRKAGTSFTDVMLSRASGKRTFFHYRGANGCLDVGDFEFEKYDAGIFHFGYPTLLDTLDLFETNRTKTSFVLEKAKEKGMTVSVDLVSVNSDNYRKIVESCLPFSDYLFMNEIETAKLTGINITKHNRTDLDETAKAARQILKRGTRTVIIHFPEGAVAFSERESVMQGSILLPPEKIAGTTGAGDAFASGFLYALHSGNSLKECLYSGVCVAASSLLDETCSGGILPISQCYDLANRYGCRDLQ